MAKKKEVAEKPLSASAHVRRVYAEGIVKPSEILQKLTEEGVDVKIGTINAVVYKLKGGGSKDGKGKDGIIEAVGSVKDLIAQIGAKNVRKLVDMLE